MNRLFVTLSIIASIATACNSNTPLESPKTDSSSSTMSSSKTDMLEKNKETALACLQAVNDHNPDGVYTNASADITDYGDGSAPPVKGIDSCKAFVKMFFTAFPDFKGENFMTVAEGNHVAVFGDWSGTFKGEMMGMKPTNKSFHIKDVDLFMFNDEGKITEHHSIQSMQTMMDQIGAKMK